MKILIIGATSAIALACARRFAAAGHELYLLARDEERLEALAQDLRIRGASNVLTGVFDARDVAAHEALIVQVLARLGGLDRVLIAHGSLSDQQRCQASAELSLEEFKVNFLSVVALLTPLANHFERQGSGSIGVIGSVAGDRGRQSNYVYGAAKGGLAVYLQGLRNRLARSGVQVLTIKPGFVDTPMTAAFDKGPLWASADRVAADIDKAFAKRRDVVYSPGFWRVIMTIIRAIPEGVFKRLSL